MAQSKATTVEQYLAELPDDRRAIVAAMRELVLRHLPEGYVESTGWGMITYGVPLARFPNTYNGQPLCAAALAAQKHHYALYLMGPYTEPAVERALRDGFAKAGKTLDMGKSCIRFKRLEDLDLDTLGHAIAAMPPERLMAHHDDVHGKREGGGGRRTTAKTGAARKATPKRGR